MLKDIKTIDKSDVFEELKKFNIGKITFDVKKYQILIETEEDQEGDTPIFSIEPGGFRNEEIQCILKQGFRDKKGHSFLEEKTATIYVPFSSILKSVYLESFLGYFSDMIIE